MNNIKELEHGEVVCEGDILEIDGNYYMIIKLLKEDSYYDYYYILVNLITGRARSHRKYDNIATLLIRNNPYRLVNSITINKIKGELKL